MKTIITILLLLSLFIGMAGATPGVTITKIPTYTWGPSQGFKNPGTIQAGDLYATDDLEVGDDVDIGGNLDVAGNLSINILESGANLTTGHITEDLIVDDGVDITAATGAEIFNYAASTGAFTTGTGTNTLSGNTVISGSKTFTTGTGLSTFLGNIYVSGTKTLTMGTGAAQFGGHVTAATAKLNTSLYSAGTLNSGGTATLNALKINGTTYSVGALSTDGTATVANAKVNGTTYSVGALTTNALLKGANIKSNATIYAVTTLNSGGTATLNAVTVNTTVNAAADGIRANSVILPGEMVITVPVTKTDFAAGELNRSIFIADDAWTITSIEEVHNVAEGTATTCTLAVQKMTGTQALNGGINITESAFNLKSTANTVVAGTLSTTSGRTTLADGNRIGLLCNMTGTNAMDAFRGGLVTIHLKRV
jgi:hypothetical protein